MKIKPSTLFLVLAALLLGGVTLLVLQQPAPKSSESGQTVSEAEQKIFEFQESDVQAFTLKTQLRSLKFERNQDGKWQMLEPTKMAASDPSVAFLLDLIATGKTPRTITAPASDREQFGFHQPMATIDLTLKDKATHTLVLGEYDFNRTYLYAQADPAADKAADLKVFLVSPSFDNAVNRPLDEWKQPAAGAKSSSPSPSASPSGSAASPEAKPSSSPQPASPDASASPSESASPEAKSESKVSPSVNPSVSPSGSPSPSGPSQDNAPDSQNKSSQNSDQ